MGKKLIAALALAVLASWHVPAALAMPSPTPVQHASQAQQQSCCPRSHVQLAAALLALVPPSKMPCGDQHPCCAKQGRENALALSAGARVERPKSDAAFRNADRHRIPSGSRIAIPLETAKFLASYFVLSTVLRN